MERKASVTIIFFTVFLDLLGFGMVLPLMPLYAADPHFHASPVEIGWLMAVYSIMQFIFAPIWGYWSDRIGRRPIIIIGLFGSFLSYLVYGLAESLVVLFLSRAMAGVMGANIAVAQAAMADITPREGRAKAMGLIGVAFGLGFIFGPALGGWLAVFGPKATPFAAAVFTGLNGISALFFLRETRSLENNSQTGRFSHPFLPSRWRVVKAFPGALMICILWGLFISLFAGLEVTLPLFVHDVFRWDMVATGWMFAYIGVISVLIQGGVVRRLSPRIGEKRLTSLGLALVASGLALLSTHGQGMLLAALALVAMGTGMTHPGFSSLASLNTSKDRQGMILGLFQSMSALGRSLGPELGGLAYVAFSGAIFPVLGLGVFIVLVVFILAGDRIGDARQGGRSDAAPLHS